MKNSKIHNWIRGIFHELRLKVIKLAIGKLSVIVNVKVYGKVVDWEGERVVVEFAGGRREQFYRTGERWCEGSREVSRTVGFAT